MNSNYKIYILQEDMVCLSCTATGERVCLAAEGFGNRHCFLENIADKVIIYSFNHTTILHTLNIECSVLGTCLKTLTDKLSLHRIHN